MARLVTIVIPTYNNTKGLQYLLDYFKNKNYQVTVVDNKKSMEKKDFIASLLHCYKDRLSYFPQKKNLGFARAVNLGVRGVQTKWMLVLNDDIEFHDGKTIFNLIKVAQKKKWDAVTPALRNPDGDVENYGYILLPHGRVSLVKDITSSRVNRTLPRLQGANELDGLTAACLLIKMDVFKKLNGFDESFFAYLEDVDLFLRFKKAGYKMGIADVEVLHNHMTTAKTMGNFKARQDMINWWRLFLKHSCKFKFNLAFIVERLRNISGYIKASLKGIDRIIKI